VRATGWARRLLSLALTAAALVFVVREVLRNLDQLRDFEWSVRPGLLVLSVVLLVLVFFWGVKVWQLLLRGFGQTVPMIPLARAWFWANLARYIPGVVWQFFSLAHHGTSAGLAPPVAVASLLVQMGFVLLSAGLFALYTLPLPVDGAMGVVLPFLRWAAPAAVLLVHPAPIRFTLRLAEKALRRPVATWSAGWSRGVGLLVLSGATWIVYGLAFHLFLIAFVDLPWTALPQVIGINALAFVVGYLAFFAPGGLGFKEGALAVLLSALLPRPVAFSLAIAARLWTIAAELLPSAFLLLGSRGARPGSTP
jgi:glycosyltransferase 2 family protein